MSVPPRRHCDDGRALFRYADRVAVRCHRCDTPGWVTGPSNARRFRCLGCSEALDGGCGCNRCGAGDWVGPVRYSGYRPCGYRGHQWVRIEVRRAHATMPLRTMAADCSQCGRSNDVEVTLSQWHGNDAIDPNFGLPLRLVEKTAAGLLWAYNAEHLQALHDYATATLREGSGHHRSMFSCLPQWMKLARNRVLLQRAVERLQRRLLQG
ncbi:TPA: hypothetical protein ACKP7W_002386 [Stenotrophomonas maltophilia]|uniref:hypothetical protein n=1 Tax=Stenotrophomonas sp. PE591 TaxID=1812490 RepID=UPI002015E7D2|nr:hypothetical protein [Stenotrophomonas sp. PE591]MBS3727847.1 hypothetical protein [Stenotrophomonas sp. PE591]